MAATAKIAAKRLKQADGDSIMSNVLFGATGMPEYELTKKPGAVDAELEVSSSTARRRSDRYTCITTFWHLYMSIQVHIQTLTTRIDSPRNLRHSATRMVRTDMMTATCESWNPSCWRNSALNHLTKCDIQQSVSTSVRVAISCSVFVSLHNSYDANCAHPFQSRSAISHPESSALSKHCGQLRAASSQPPSRIRGCSISSAKSKCNSQR